MGTTKAVWPNIQPSMLALILVAKPALANTPCISRTRGVDVPLTSPSMFFCWRMSTYLVTGPCSCPPSRLGSQTAHARPVPLRSRSDVRSCYRRKGRLVDRPQQEGPNRAR